MSVLAISVGSQAHGTLREAMRCDARGNNTEEVGVRVDSPAVGEATLDDAGESNTDGRVGEREMGTKLAKEVWLEAVGSEAGGKLVARIWQRRRSEWYARTACVAGATTGTDRLRMLIMRLPLSEAAAATQGAAAACCLRQRGITEGRCCC